MEEENLVADLVEGVDYVRVLNECDVIFSDDFWDRQEAKYGLPEPAEV